MYVNALMFHSATGSSCGTQRRCGQHARPWWRFMRKRTDAGKLGKMWLSITSCHSNRHGFVGCTAKPICRSSPSLKITRRAIILGQIAPMRMSRSICLPENINTCSVSMGTKLISRVELEKRPKRGSSGSTGKRWRMRCRACARRWQRAGRKGTVRFTIKKPPWEYARFVKCPHCKSTDVASDEHNRRNELEKQTTCICGGYPFPHRSGSLRGCDGHPQIDVPMDEEEWLDYEACLATPRSG